jgi:hypothetical protein
LYLPHPERAVVDLEKIRDYCLNFSHSLGRHKARVFVSALGITSSKAAWLRALFLQAARDREANPGAVDLYGQRYSIDIAIDGPGGSATVRTTWIVRTSEDFARLTSCYVL